MIDILEYVECLRKDKQIPFPWIIQLEITDICPFACPQCYKKGQLNKQMDFTKIVQMLKECSENGTKLFVLNGGEPLLYYKIIDLIKIINKMPINVNCFTSGFGLTEEIIELWNFEKDKLCLSLNGSTEQVNVMSREGYEVTISAMKLLKEKRKRYGVNWVASSKNIFDFKKLLKLCEQMKASFLFVTCEKITGEGNAPNILSEEQFDFLKQTIITYQGEVCIYVENCYTRLYNEVRKGASSQYFAGCFAGKYGCHIDMEGNYSPCTHIDKMEAWGSINEYWKNSKIIKELNQNRKDKILQMPCIGGK